MNTAAIIALHLLAIEPASLDAAARVERIEQGAPVTRDMLTPGLIRGRQAGESIAARALACYHPSATPVSYRNLGYWRQAWEEGGDHSAVFRIDYRGLTGTRYTMDVAVVSRIENVNIHSAKSRAYVLADNALLPAKPDCELNTWQALEL